MATHVPSVVWTARVDGKIVAAVRTLNEEQVELLIKLDGEDDCIINLTRHEAGAIAKRIRQCLDDTRSGGKYDAKGQERRTMLRERAEARGESRDS